MNIGDSLLVALCQEIMKLVYPYLDVQFATMDALVNDMPYSMFMGHIPQYEAISSDTSIDPVVQQYMEDVTLALRLYNDQFFNFASFQTAMTFVFPYTFQRHAITNDVGNTRPNSLDQIPNHTLNHCASLTKYKRKDVEHIPTEAFDDYHTAMITSTKMCSSILKTVRTHGYTHVLDLSPGSHSLGHFITSRASDIIMKHGLNEHVWDQANIPATSQAVPNCDFDNIPTMDPYTLVYYDPPYTQVPAVSDSELMQQYISSTFQRIKQWPDNINIIISLPVSCNTALLHLFTERTDHYTCMVYTGHIASLLHIKKCYNTLTRDPKKTKTAPPSSVVNPHANASLQSTLDTISSLPVKPTIQPKTPDVPTDSGHASPPKSKMASQKPIIVSSSQKIPRPRKDKIHHTRLTDQSRSPRNNKL